MPQLTRTHTEDPNKWQPSEICTLTSVFYGQCTFVGGLASVTYSVRDSCCFRDWEGQGSTAFSTVFDLSVIATATEARRSLSCFSVYKSMEAQQSGRSFLLQWLTHHKKSMRYGKLLMLQWLGWQRSKAFRTLQLCTSPPPVSIRSVLAVRSKCPL